MSPASTPPSPAPAFDLDDEVERATTATLRDEDIERAQATVGVYRASGAQEYVRMASPDAIRNFALGVGDDNPLFVDPAYGRTTRWGGQIAPPSMAAVVNDRLQRDPARPPVRAPRFKGINLFVSGGSWEWFRPLHPGDTLYQISGVESVEVKESSFAERSVVQTWRYVKLNQRAEVVAVHRVIGIYAERKTAREKGKYRDVEPATYTEAELAEIDAVYAAESRRGAEPRYWEDVVEGEALPPMAKGPLTVTDIIVFHAGGYGFTPYAPATSRLGFANRRRIPGFYVKNPQGVPDVAQRVHWDSAWAQAIGNPMAYDYGVMRESWLTHYLTDWIGDDGWVVRQDDQVRRFNYMGDTQFLSGEVVAKRRGDDGLALVDVALRCTNQRGEVTVPATATVALPTRDRPVVLPAPPREVAETAVEIFAEHGRQLRIGGPGGPVGETTKEERS